MSHSFSTIPFDERDAEQFGKLKAILQTRGDTLADLDITIAAQAATRGLALVTNDVRHFKRVPGVKFENWVRRMGSPFSPGININFTFTFPNFTCYPVFSSARELSAQEFAFQSDLQ